MQAHQIKFPRTAHYYTIGKPSAEIKKLIFVFHGYGQLASQIIHKFDAVGDDTLVVAPEGFSRFYWNEAKGIVGASWMTKKDRLSEIEDYCNYLEYLFHHFTNLVATDAKVVVIGFSQGGATAVRWLERNRPAINHLVLWGAAFPMDLNYLPMHSYLKNIETHLVYGTKDQYLSDERIKMHDLFTKQQQLSYSMIWFEGKHELDRTTLYQLLSSI